MKRVYFGSDGKSYLEFPASSIDPRCPVCKRGILSFKHDGHAVFANCRVGGANNGCGMGSVICFDDKVTNAHVSLWREAMRNYETRQAIG
jgi:hypothetical protein